MAEPKTYVPRTSVRERTFPDGGSLINIVADAHELAEFVQNRAAADGRIRLCITKRREVGKYGETHCLWLDTYVPKPKQADRAVEPPKQPDLPPTETDDVPF